MRKQFLPMTLLLGLTLAVSACAGGKPRRPGGASQSPSTLAEQRSEFLRDCARREQLNQPRPVECPDSAPDSVAQPQFGPLLPPVPSLPTLPGGLIR